MDPVVESSLYILIPLAILAVICFYIEYRRSKKRKQDRKKVPME